MSSSNFVDYVKIHVTSGNGGSGSMHFHRSKINPMGGPDGGNGGRGGHIILRGNKNMWTLLHLKYRKHIKASHGENGSSNNKFGAEGADEFLEVPLGTVVKDEDSDQVIHEITTHGEEYILMPGGRGGKGNTHFKSSTHQAPKFAQPGEPGVEGWRILELKLLGDVGLVGFPNAGKSTLLASISGAKPKIANYAFTTLTPNLGLVPYRDNRSFVMADIPGIIEDAHLGKGIGHRFLRHIERNAVLLFMISAQDHDISKQYDILVNELKQFNPELIDKPRLLAITKRDTIDDELEEMLKTELPTGIEHIFISSITGYQLDALKDKLWDLLNSGVDEA